MGILDIIIKEMRSNKKQSKEYKVRHHDNADEFAKFCGRELEIGRMTDDEINNVNGDPEDFNS